MRNYIFYSIPRKLFQISERSSLRNFFTLATLTWMSLPISYAEMTSSELVDALETPRHLRHIPSWGIELSSSFQPFGGTALTHSQRIDSKKAYPIYAFSLAFDYQPSFFQRFNIGVLGLGPSLTLYPIPKSGIAPSFFSLFGAGGQVRYQAKFFDFQPIVPMISYNWEFFRYQFLSIGNGNLFAQGPALGLWVNLNFLESSSATSMFDSTGISRSYIVLEWKKMMGKNDAISYQDGSFYVGLRFEF